MKSSRLPLLCVLLFNSLVASYAAAQGLGLESPYKSPNTAEVPRETLAGGTKAAQIWDDLQARKDAILPATLGAWHWWRVPTGGPGDSGYGSSSLPDTYYYYLMLDPTWKTEHRFWRAFGLHSELRLREKNAFRSTMDSTFWSYETYAWLDTPAGLFKAGQIRRKLGLDWDGSFYGNTAYYDGLKLNADIGLSWERVFTLSPRLTIDTTAQFFFREDGISGSLLGGDAEGTSTFRLQNNAVLRVVPTWWFSPTSSLALGLTGSIGQVAAHDPLYQDHRFSAWGVDLTYTRERFKIFAEVLQTHGALVPYRYVSGGMSSRTTNVLAGISYTTGPVTWRATWSAGYDHAPSGHQHMFVPGVTIAITKNIDLYLEYVKWDVTSSSSTAMTFENGFQAALNWRF